MLIQRDPFAACVPATPKLPLDIRPTPAKCELRSVKERAQQ